MKKIKWVDFIKNLICGIAIGAGAILPGISGGVLCVIFGVYQSVMELFSHPIKSLKKNWKMFLTIGVGWLIGFVFFAKVIEWIFMLSELYSTWLFAGLILGTVPALYKEAGKKGHTKGGCVSMIIGGAVVLVILLLVKYVVHFSVTPNIAWYGFAGVLWGISLVVPGMSSSPVLLALDLYQPLNSGLANLDFGVILPWVIGMAATALLLARGINHFFKMHYSVAYHGVVGIVVASTLMIIPIYYENPKQFFVGVLFGAVGYVIAFISEKLDLKAKPAGEEAE